MKRGWAAGVLAACLLVPSLAAAEETTGVLVLAHGGSPEWNAAVREAAGAAGIEGPVEVAFGMGMKPEDVPGMQKALDALARRGASRTVVVPLLVSSASMVMRQYEYLFGQREEASWEGVPRLRLSTPVILARPMDADPLIAEILLERAAALSRDAGAETVVLVGHGPSREADQRVCLAEMEQLADRIRSRGGFQDVVAVTMRDDAPEAVVETAVQQMRETVERHAAQGRVLVVPLLIASGGVEGKIPERLKGLDFVYDGATLLPHPNISRWIARRADEAASQAAAGMARAPSGAEAETSMRGVRVASQGHL